MQTFFMQALSIMDKATDVSTPQCEDSGLFSSPQSSNGESDFTYSTPAAEVVWFTHLAIVLVAVAMIILYISASTTIVTGNYRAVVEENKEFILNKLRRPEEIAASLLKQNCITFDDCAGVESAKLLRDQCLALLNTVITRSCCESFFIALGEYEPHLKTYLCNKLSTKGYSVRFDNINKKDKVLSKRDSRNLKKHYSELRYAPSVDFIIDSLYSGHVISLEQIANINTRETKFKRMGAVLTDVIGRGTYGDLHVLWTAFLEHDLYRAALISPILQQAGLITGHENCEDNQIQSSVLQCLENPEDLDMMSNNIELPITNVERGSVKLMLDLHAWHDVVELADAICGKALRKKILSHIEENMKVDLRDHNVIISLEVQSPVPEEADLCDKEVRYAYCASRQSWYWSLDNDSWCHASVHIWPFGDLPCKVLEEKSQAILQRLMFDFEEKDECSNNCIVCATRALCPKMVQDEIMEKLEVALVLKFYLRESQSVTEKEKTEKEIGRILHKVPMDPKYGVLKRTELQDMLKRQSMKEIGSKDAAKRQGLGAQTQSLRGLLSGTLIKEKEVELPSLGMAVALVRGELWCSCRWDGIRIHSMELEQRAHIQRDEMIHIYSVADVGDAVVVAAQRGLVLLSYSGERVKTISSGCFSGVCHNNTELYAACVDDSSIHRYDMRDWQETGVIETLCNGGLWHTVTIQRGKLVTARQDEGRKRGGGVGEFHRRVCVCDADHMLLVADVDNDRLQLRDEKHQWHELALQPPPYRPTAAVYTGDALYVCSSCRLIKYVHK